MRQSNTGHRSVTYDSTRDRYRCEMRVGKISRTARCKTLKAALEIRAAWAKERDELEANAAKVTPSGGKAAFLPPHRAARGYCRIRLSKMGRNGGGRGCSAAKPPGTHLCPFSLYVGAPLRLAGFLPIGVKRYNFVI